jgi:hypothetical protein
MVYMKMATIVPTAYLDLTEHGDYFMALAHLVGKDKVYTEFFKKQADRGAFVLLDNGVIEGDQQTIEAICKKAILINATEIILPDVFLDGDATLESSMKALDFVKRYYPNLKTMAVPQGRNMEEWLQCAALMLEWDIDSIGIPKKLTDIEGRDARLLAIATLHQAMPKLLKSVEIHLLGCWDNPIECTMIEKAVQQGDIPVVRGCDSAIAYVYARENMLIVDGPRPTGEIKFDAKDVTGDLLPLNITIWEQAGNIDKQNEKVVKIHF